MDKLSRLGVGLDDFSDAEIESLTYILPDVKESDKGEPASDDDSDDKEDDESPGKGDSREYNVSFSITVPEVYKGHAEKAMEHEYSKREDASLVVKLDDWAAGDGVADRNENGHDMDMNLLIADGAENIEYRGGMAEAGQGVMMDERATVTYDSGLLNIEYERPEMINGQATYQRIVFEAEKDGETVYEMTMRKFMDAGMEASSEYDPEFDTLLITSLNRKAEGDGGNFNEFYLNGEIGDNSVDKQLLMAGDVVEWRYAEETDGSCGGVPDFKKIKQMLNQYQGNGMDGGMYQNPSPIENDLLMPLFQNDFQRPYGLAA